MGAEVRKKEGESANSLIYRFSKRTQQSGVLREAKKRIFYKRPKTRIKRRLSALHRAVKMEEYKRAKKQGLL